MGEWMNPPARKAGSMLLSTSTPAVPCATSNINYRGLWEDGQMDGWVDGKIGGRVGEWVGG